MFDQLQKLPAYLTIQDRGRSYECSPAVLCSGSAVRLSYISGAFEHVLSERIKTQKELDEMIDDWAGVLGGMKQLYAHHAFIHKTGGRK